jgi:hypothetical protein
VHSAPETTQTAASALWGLQEKMEVNKEKLLKTTTEEYLAQGKER